MREGVGDTRMSLMSAVDGSAAGHGRGNLLWTAAGDNCHRTDDNCHFVRQLGRKHDGRVCYPRHATARQAPSLRFTSLQPLPSQARLTGLAALVRGGWEARSRSKQASSRVLLLAVPRLAGLKPRRGCPLCFHVSRGAGAGRGRGWKTPPAGAGCQRGGPARRSSCRPRLPSPSRGPHP